MLLLSLLLMITGFILLSVALVFFTFKMVSGELSPGLYLLKTKWIKISLAGLVLILTGMFLTWQAVKPPGD